MPGWWAKKKIRVWIKSGRHQSLVERIDRPMGGYWMAESEPLKHTREAQTAVRWSPAGNGRPLLGGSSLSPSQAITWCRPGRPKAPRRRHQGAASRDSCLHIWRRLCRLDHRTSVPKCEKKNCYHVVHTIMLNMCIQNQQQKKKLPCCT